MSELALYRKYRPKTFAEVLGQEGIVSVLQNSIKEKNISHAYLFSGGRGTGKTTVARIFAAGVGCKPTDLYEIDAASNRSIDDVRDLREAVKTMPFESPYKVYIIDEAHMLTKEAFNALLKTLEEPPEHVIFVLATTEKEKLPDTIISRCQTFTFRQPAIAALRDLVIDVSKKEKVKIDAPTAELVALFGDGSFRDTLSVLEKVLHSAVGGKVDADTAAKIIGAPTGELINTIVRALAEGNIAGGLESCRKANDEGIDMKVYTKMLLAKLRAVLLLRYAPQMEKEFAGEFSPDDIKLIKDFASDKEKRINSHTLIKFLEAYDMLGYSVISSLPIELALIKSVGEKKEQG